MNIVVFSVEIKQGSILVAPTSEDPGKRAVTFSRSREPVFVYRADSPPRQGDTLLHGTGVYNVVAIGYEIVDTKDHGHACNQVMVHAQKVGERNGSEGNS